jgi:predicted TIM-barrel fold metal-dependent hydrolase
MSADLDEKDRGGYPTGPVSAPGRVSELLARYPNLHADLSAGSGFNAVSRDPEFGYRFLEEHQDKLLFGTDICHVNQPVDIVPYINEARRSGRISEQCYRKVTHANAVRLLGLEE